MEVILSTAFGVKAETQTVENDPITESAKKAMAPNPVAGLLCKYFKIYKRDCGKGDTRELTPKDGWNTQDGRMTKKCLRLGMHSLGSHFFVILPS